MSHDKPTSPPGILQATLDAERHRQWWCPGKSPIFADGRIDGRSAGRTTAEAAPRRGRRSAMPETTPASRHRHSVEPAPETVDSLSPRDLFGIMPARDAA